MLITPDSNESLDNYVQKRNIRNSTGTLDGDYDEEESMDETDAKLNSNTDRSTPKLDDETDVTETTETRPSRTFRNRPGGAVKINRGDTIVKRSSTGGGSCGVTPVKKVGGGLLERTISTSLDAQDTEKEISTYDELNSDDSLTPTLSLNNSRTGTAKDYNEMIKFVFTEHGIRVISDKEYVV